MIFLITGDQGFIGSNLKKLLQKKKIKFITANKKNFGDLSKKKSWKKIPKSNVVIHLASPTGIRDSYKNSKKYIKKVLNINKNVISYCIKNNAKLIFPSSVVYGNNKKKILSENCSVYPNNPYLVSKFNSESLIKNYYKKKKLSYIILRIFNVYGPKQKEKFIIPTIFKGLTKKIHLKNLNFSRDFIYIDDVITSILKAAKIKKNQIINIGSGRSYKILEIINIINQISKKRVKFFNQNVKLRGEVKNTCANIQKAKKILKWKPKTNIKKGLKKVYYTLKK